MKAEGMGFRAIAELCGVAETTVNRWAASCNLEEISCKMQKARETSKAAEFTLEETLAIIRAGGKGLLADLLEQNARGGLPVPKSAPILSGAYFRELRFMVKDRILSPLQVQKILGVAPAKAEDPLPPLIALERPATEAEAAAAFDQLFKAFPRPGLPAGSVERVVRAAAGATRKTLKAIARETAQGGLFS